MMWQGSGARDRSRGLVVPGELLAFCLGALAALRTSGLQGAAVWESSMVKERVWTVACRGRCTTRRCSSGQAGDVDQKVQRMLARSEAVGRSSWWKVEQEVPECTPEQLRMQQGDVAGVFQVEAIESATAATTTFESESGLEAVTDIWREGDRRCATHVAKASAYITA